VGGLSERREGGCAYVDCCDARDQNRLERMTEGTYREGLRPSAFDRSRPSSAASASQGKPDDSLKDVVQTVRPFVCFTAVISRDRVAVAEPTIVDPDLCRLKPSFYLALLDLI
jgi:hypothetical protein